MDRKRVVYLYDNYPSYRTDFFERLNAVLHGSGFDFALFYGRKEKNDSRQGDVGSFEIKSFPLVETSIGGVEYKRFKRFKKAFRLAKPDVVVLQFHVSVLTYWWVFLYLKLHRIPFIIWECNYTRDTLGRFSVRIRRKLVDFTFLEAAACISYGSVFRDYLLKLGRKPEDVFVAQNTIDIQKIIDNRAPSCANRHFNHPLRMLYVGALIDRKYVDSSIIAVAHVIQQGNDLFYDIVGDGPEREKLNKLVGDLNMNGRIVLHGAKHGRDLQSFFENNDLFLLPGTGGLAINEAMAYSLPVLSTVGDDTIVDLIDGNGYLLKDFGNSDEIEEALKVFVALPEEKKTEMSHRSEQIVRERASLDNMVVQHLKAIEYVLESEETGKRMSRRDRNR